MNVAMNKHYFVNIYYKNAETAKTGHGSIIILTQIRTFLQSFCKIIAKNNNWAKTTDGTESIHTNEYGDVKKFVEKHLEPIFLT